MKKIIGLMLILFLAACTVNVNNVPQQKTVSVQGSAEFATAPDEAKLYIRIETKANTPKIAQDMGKERSNAVIAVLKKEGFDEKNIQTTQYNLAKQERWDDNENKMVTTGHLLTHVLEATTKKIDAAGSVADIVVQAGATGVDSVQFTISDEKKKEVNELALKIAAENAREKAATIAKSLGVSLGKAESVTESNVYYSPRYGGYAMMAKDMMESAPTEIQPSDVTVTAQVSVAFGIN